MSLCLFVPYQDMPDVLIGPLKAAEAHAGPEQTLPPPHVVGHHLQLPHPLGLHAVQLQLDRFLHIGLQKVFQQVTLLILVVWDTRVNAFLSSILNRIIFFVSRNN